jgi:ABC-type nitrate/sulfonate/bicarbonate transport system substrate-binding protein
MTLRALLTGVRFMSAVLSAGISSSYGNAAEKLVGFQSAPSMAMALPWIAEEALLYSKYDLDFQLVYIASSGIVTAAMSGGSGSVAIVGGEGPIRAFLGGNTDFVFIGSVKNVLTHSIMGKADIKKPEDLKGRRIGVAGSVATRITSLSTAFARRGWI